MVPHDKFNNTLFEEFMTSTHNECCPVNAIELPPPQAGSSSQFKPWRSRRRRRLLDGVVASRGSRASGRPTTRPKDAFGARRDARRVSWTPGQPPGTPAPHFGASKSMMSGGLGRSAPIQRGLCLAHGRIITLVLGISRRLARIRYAGRLCHSGQGQQLHAPLAGLRVRADRHLLASSCARRVVSNQMISNQMYTPHHAALVQPTPPAGRTSTSALLVARAHASVDR